MTLAKVLTIQNCFKEHLIFMHFIILDVTYNTVFVLTKRKVQLIAEAKVLTKLPTVNGYRHKTWREAYSV